MSFVFDIFQEFRLHSLSRLYSPFFARHYNNNTFSEDILDIYSQKLIIYGWPVLWSAYKKPCYEVGSWGIGQALNGF